MIEIRHRGRAAQSDDDRPRSKGTTLIALALGGIASDAMATLHLPDGQGRCSCMLSFITASAFFRLRSSRSSVRSSVMREASDSLPISATRNAVVCCSSPSDVFFLDLGPIALSRLLCNKHTV